MKQATTESWHIALQVIFTAALATSMSLLLYLGRQATNYKENIYMEELQRQNAARLLDITKDGNLTSADVTDIITKYDRVYTYIITDDIDNPTYAIVVNNEKLKELRKIISTNNLNTSYLDSIQKIDNILNRASDKVEISANTKDITNAFIERNIISKYVVELIVNSGMDICYKYDTVSERYKECGDTQNMAVIIFKANGVDPQFMPAVPPVPHP